MSFPLRPAESLTLQKCVTYFNESNKWKELSGIINLEDEDVALSRIESFVMQYAPANDTKYLLKTKGGSRTFVVADEYKTEIRQYTKRLMEPFKRDKNRLIRINAGDNLTITTTIGQLNYMRWAFQGGVIKYMRMHPEISLRRKGGEGTSSRSDTQPTLAEASSSASTA